MLYVCVRMTFYSMNLVVFSFASQLHVAKLKKVAVFSLNKLPDAH